MSISDTLLAIPVWWINGILSILYWAGRHLAELAVLLAGAVLLVAIDPPLQRRASERPRRHDRGGVQTASPNAQLFTLAVLAAWLAVSLSSRFPIPLIGAFLWWVGLLGILSVPEERFNQLWWAKAGILVYAGLVAVLRLALGTLAQVSPADWAGVVGSRADAQVVLTSTRSNLATVGMLAVLVLYPLGYVGLLVNRFLRNPKPLTSIGLEAGEVIRRLRTRQE